jgi:hypothetical protein
MRESLQIAIADISPDMESVLSLQGWPAGTPADERIHSIFRKALELLEEEAAPKGLVESVSADQFERVYQGAGGNEPETPVGDILPRFPGSRRLALFAVTLGQGPNARIARLFEERDFALASMLDAVASEATDKAGDVLEEHYSKALRDSGEVDPSWRSLRYSPGYCGWHVSGQRALFDALRPEEIGISLRESCLMEPLKSMTGVIITGPPEIHEFDDSYPFCADCTTHGCRERIRSVFQDNATDPHKGRS